MSKQEKSREMMFSKIRECMYYRSIAFLLLNIIVSCNKKPGMMYNYHFPKNSKSVQIKLIDSLGKLTLSIPLRYDTFSTWINYSDCGKPCNEQEYRFQSKLLRIIHESGFIWNRDPNIILPEIRTSGLVNNFRNLTTTNEKANTPKIRSRLQSQSCS